MYMGIFNTEDFLSRFKDRAEAVSKRGIPPVGGEDRNAFIKQAELDFLDCSVVASSARDIVIGLWGERMVSPPNHLA